MIRRGSVIGIYESLSLGIPVIVTKLPILQEIGVNQDNGFILEFDMSNLDVNEIYRKAGKFKFDYKQKPDIWGDLLTNTATTYKEEKNMKVKVKATSKYMDTNTSDSELTAQDKENKRVVPEEGKEWITEKERAEMLEEKGFVTIVEEIKEEITEEVVQAVAKGIVEEAKEQDKTVENIVDEIIEESKEVVEEKPKKTTRKRTTKK